MSSSEGSMSSHLGRQDRFVNLENRWDREVARFESKSSRPTRSRQRSHNYSKSQNCLSNEIVGL